MKKLLFALSLLFLACSGDPGFTSKDGQPGIVNDKGGISPLCCSCNNTCCFGSTFRFGLTGSTVSLVTQNVHYFINVVTKVNANSDGSPLSDPTKYRSDLATTITYKIYNTGHSQWKYKEPNFGNWVTVNPGLWAVFTRNALPFGCSKNVTVQNFSLEVIRLNCGTMPSTGNHFNAVVRAESATNGYTTDLNTIAGFNTASLVCPL
jgi:hypothetical protein